MSCSGDDGMINQEESDTLRGRSERGNKRGGELYRDKARVAPKPGPPYLPLFLTPDQAHSIMSKIFDLQEQNAVSHINNSPWGRKI